MPERHSSQLVFRQIAEAVRNRHNVAEPASKSRRAPAYDGFHAVSLSGRFVG